MLILLGIVHIIICILVFVLRKMEVIKTKNCIVPMVFLIPLFGLCALGAEEYVLARKMEQEKETDNYKKIVLDKKYKKISVDSGLGKGAAVPLEEAMLMNDAGASRELMLNILQKNPENYIEILNRVKSGDDVELTHFATTTIMEIQGDYEKKLQELAEEMEEKGNEITLLDRYISRLHDYIESGLLSGNVLMLQKQRLKRRLEAYLELAPDDKDKYLLYLETLLDLSELKLAGGGLNKAMEKWPREEKVYRLMVQYYRLTYQGEKLRRLFGDIKTEGVYLSREGREWMRFWTGGSGRQEAYGALGDRVGGHG